MNSAISAIHDIEAELVEIRDLIEAVMALTGNDSPEVDPNVSTAVAEAAKAKCNKVLDRCNTAMNTAAREDAA